MKIAKKDADSHPSSSSSAAIASHHDNDVIMNGYHSNANMIRQMSTSSTTSSIKSHHHQQGVGRSSSESTMMIGGGSGVGGEIRMSSSNSNFIAHPRNRSNADMVHASYARLLEKVQRVEEENGNLLKIAETQKLEYNKVAAQVVEAEMEQTRLEHECMSLRKKIDELTELNEQLTIKHRSISESSSPEIMTSPTTNTSRGGGGNHLQHLAQQTGLSEQLINQLFTRLAPFLSVLLTTHDFDAYKDTTTTTMMTSSSSLHRHQSSEEDSAIDTNDEMAVGVGSGGGQLSLLRHHHQQPQPQQPQQLDYPFHHHHHQQFDIIPTSTLASSNGGQQQPPCQPKMGIQAAAKRSTKAADQSWSSSPCFQPPPEPSGQVATSPAMTSWCSAVASQPPPCMEGGGYLGNGGVDDDEWMKTDEAEVGRRVENSLYECLEECRKEEQRDMEGIGRCRGDNFSSQHPQDVAEHWSSFDEFERKFYSSPCAGPITYQHRDDYVTTTTTTTTTDGDYVTVDRQHEGNFPELIVENNCAPTTIGPTAATAEVACSKIIKRNSYEEACGKTLDFIATASSSPTYLHGNGGDDHFRAAATTANNRINARDDYKTDDDDEEDDSDDVTFPCQQYQQQQASYQQQQQQQQVADGAMMMKCREPDTGILGNCAQMRAEVVERSSAPPPPEVEPSVAIATPAPPPTTTTNSSSKKKSPEKGLFKQKSLQQQRNRKEQLSYSPKRPIYNNGDHHRSGSCDFTLLPTRPLLQSSFSAGSDQSHQQQQKLSSSSSSDGVAKKSDHGRSLVGMMKSKFAKSSGKLSSQKSPRHKDASNEFTAHPGLRPPSSHNKKTPSSGHEKKSIADARIRRSATEAIIGHKLSGQKCGGGGGGGEAPHLAASRLTLPKVDAETFSDEGFAESSTIERMERSDDAEEEKLTGDDAVVTSPLSNNQQQQQMLMRKACKQSSMSSNFPSTSSSSASSSSSSSRDVATRKGGYKLQPLISNQDEKPARNTTQSAKNKPQQQFGSKPPQQRKNLPAPKIKARTKHTEQVKERSFDVSSGGGGESQISASGQQIPATSEEEDQTRKKSQCYYGRPPLPTYQEARMKQRMTRTMSNPAAPVDHQPSTRQQPVTAGPRRPSAASASPASAPMTSLSTASPSRISYSNAPSSGKEGAGKSKLRSLYASPPPPTEQRNSSDPAAKPRMKRTTTTKTSSSSNNNNNNNTTSSNNSNNNSPSRLSRLIRPTR